MATSLAANIKNRFGLHANLIEGHNGIYEITVNNTLVYTNTACEHPPIEEDVFAEINKYKAPLTRQSLASQNLPGSDIDDYADAPACSWTPPTANQPA
jgi:hypothetical protein